MAELIDIDAYFQRIGYSGDRTPTLGTLRAIHGRHTEAIPFENLDPLLQRPIRLDIDSLQRKLVDERRGGYCFEHNLLLGHALRALGFRVVNLAGRVVWNAPEGAVTPRTHMLLHVEIDGAPYIADAGFGGQTLTAPLRFVPDAEQKTPHGPFRLLSTGGAYLLQAGIRGAWKSLYRFDLQEQQLPDYEVSNWYASTHPNSHFVHGLMAARAAPERRYALRNNELTAYDLAGNAERRVLTSAAELRETLEGIFLLNLPDVSGLDALLARLTAPQG